ncbi:L-lactate MFS transporter [Paralcaligenes ureilyticus]|uniref:Nitrate/nitrite transporter NarK n=1 Tax=Paralcaligenes ureilyticus TaxID=627131 RepID=A0A4R3MBY3_9BURK|nr:OFA family MFS transporter [Paralcaligenes ureilyticus]TCT10876.1 nitrate/nitrite transporter NarK [Paralcaligenes ureilyticus]
MSSNTTDHGFFSKERITAKPGFNRWMIPPAALAVHLCIGQAYAFSVFNNPMTRLIGIDKSAPGDWSLATLGWIFSLAITFLGLSAAFAGKWLEDVGPRKAMFAAACCFGGGFMLGALGIAWHQLWLVYLGYGVIGGMGLGIGYVSPVSTLIKWFPDRRGMATGMAIMGFGGGAFIASPLSVALMQHFRSPTSMGVAQTFVVLGILYFISMNIGALAIRIPAPDWKPDGWTPPVKQNALISRNHVHIDQAMKTPQFWLVWWALCLNVTGGIGVIGQASVMIQESFKGHITPAAAAGFVGLLSLANMLGRFFWSSASDYIGRKNTYYIFLALGALLFFLVPGVGAAGNVALFVLFYIIIISMYGGGFSTVPAYLADLFGTRYVGGIHGRLLTAWAAGGIFGPVLVNYIRQYQVAHGVPPAAAYTDTMYIMAVLLIIGFICNYFVRPVSQHHHMTSEQLSFDQQPAMAAK